MSVATQQQAFPSVNHAGLLEERRRAAALHAQALENARHETLANTVGAFLPIMDALLALKDSSSESRGTSNKQKVRRLRDGIMGVSDLSIQTLQKLGVTLIRPGVGDLFRPDLHEALAIHGTHAPGREDGHVHEDSQSSLGDLAIVKVVETGYGLNGKVLRPARVEVTGTGYEK